MALHFPEDTNVEEIRDPLYSKQREGVAKMRASLLACAEGTDLSQQAIHNITVLRVYHQLSRIIRYLELMDKLEAKLYESLEYKIDTSDIQDDSTWVSLLAIQEKLQKMMIDSQKLIEPYLDLSEFTVVDTVTSETEVTSTLTLDATSRDRLRNNAKQVLIELNAS